MIDALVKLILGALSIMPIYLIASTGEMLSQKSGVYNIGIEGVMAFGAITAIVFYGFVTPNIWSSMIVGFFGGCLFGIMNSYLSIYEKLNQVVVGFGLWFLGIGIAAFIYTLYLSGSPPTENFGKILFSLDPIFYISIAIWLALAIVIKKTGWGLRINAVGEDPMAADSVGIQVDRVRLACVVVGCGLMGLAGAYLFINFMQGYRTMVAGYGWISFVLVMFAKWNVNYLLPGAFLFSIVGGLQLRLQAVGISFLPEEFMSVLPHIVVILVLVISAFFGAGKVIPSALGEPFERTEK